MPQALSLRSGRLGPGEWALGIGSVLLLADLFGVTWFRSEAPLHGAAAMLSQRVSASGWQSLKVLGPLALVVSAAGIAVWVATATRRSPALPVVLTTLLLPVAFALAILAAVRVLLDPPSVHVAQAGGADVIQTQPGAYAGLLLSIALFVGAFVALRREDADSSATSRMIETIDVQQSPSRPPA